MKHKFRTKLSNEIFVCCQFHQNNQLIKISNDGFH